LLKSTTRSRIDVIVSGAIATSASCTRIHTHYSTIAIQRRACHISTKGQNFGGMSFAKLCHCTFWPLRPFPVNIREDIGEIFQSYLVNHRRSQCIFYIYDMLLHFKTTINQRQLGQNSKPNFGLWTSAKISWRVMCEMYACHFQPEPRTQHLIGFWHRCTRRAARTHVW